MHRRVLVTGLGGRLAASGGTACLLCFEESVQRPDL